MWWSRVSAAQLVFAGPPHASLTMCIIRSITILIGAKSIDGSFSEAMSQINWHSCKRETFDDKPPREVRRYASSAQMLCLKIQKELNEVKKE